LRLAGIIKNMERRTDEAAKKNSREGLKSKTRTDTGVRKTVVMLVLS
jgi:hypothetical protein